MSVNGVLITSRQHLEELTANMSESVKSFLIAIYESKYSS